MDICCCCWFFFISYTCYSYVFFFILGQFLKRQYSVYNAIAASAFILCIANPYCIFEVGFQLSYSAVIGIVYFQPKFFKLLSFKNKLINKLWALSCVTLAAQLTTMPIVLFYFHQFPSYFLVSNLILIILTTLIVYSALLLLICSWIPIIFNLLGHFLGNELLVMNNLVKWFEGLPYAVIDNVYINFCQCILLFVIIILGIVYIKSRKVLVINLIISLLIIVFGFSAYHHYKNNKQQILTIYNVKNSTYINFVNGSRSYCLRDNLNKDNYFDYQTRNNLIKLGLSSSHNLKVVTTCESLPFSYHNFIKFGSKLFYFANNDLPEVYDAKMERITINYLLVSNQTNLDPEKIMRYFYPEEIIIDSSVSNLNAEKWLDFAEKYNIPCYSVRKSGAFVLKL